MTEAVVTRDEGRAQSAALADGLKHLHHLQREVSCRNKDQRPQLHRHTDLERLDNRHRVGQRFAATRRRGHAQVAGRCVRQAQ